MSDYVTPPCEQENCVRCGKYGPDCQCQSELSPARGSGVALPPSKIWLQWDGTGEPSSVPIEKRGEICWCQDKIRDGDIEYMRRDEVEKLFSNLKNLRSAVLDLARQYERELNAENEDVLLHSMLRVELTNALKLDSLKPRTRQGNSELVALVDELKSTSVAALSNAAPSHAEKNL